MEELWKFIDAIDGAQLVKSEQIPGAMGYVVQVWHGGTTVNVWTVWPGSGKATNTDVWSSSTEQGYPHEREKIAGLMDEHSALLEAEREEVL